jgi:Pectate lyase superfamily protein
MRRPDSAAGPTRRGVLKSAFSGATVGFALRSPMPAAALDVADSGVMNVRGFGALGDGVTDDTDAIAAAVAAAFDPVSGERNVVFLPAGIYLMTRHVELNYGIVIEGAGLAATVIKMSPTILSNMFVGAGGFPVSIEFRNLTLDGGYSWDKSGTSVPAATGRTVVPGTYYPGDFYQQLQVTGSTVPIGRGDVLRTAGQPATFCTDGTPRPAGAAAAVTVPMWAPAEANGSTRWSIFKEGDLISNIGRLTVDNCCLIGAKRHCISLSSSGEIRITRSKLGVSQGCGVFSDSAGDGAIANCWFSETGGANIYTYNAYDFRFAHCLIEGGAVANVYSDAGQVKVSSSDLWGGRAGNIVARQSGWIRGVDLQVRDPGTGGTSTTLGSTGWPRPSARPAIDCHFSDADAGAVLTGVVLASASDATGPYSPHSVVRILNGTRSNLAQIEFHDGITFERRPIDDAGSATAVRSCRGHVGSPVHVHTLPGPDAVLINQLGVPAVLLVKTLARIESVKVGAGSAAIEVFDGGTSGDEPWQRQYTTPPIAPGGAVTITTEITETALSTIWFPV